MSPTEGAPNPCSLLFFDWRDQSRLEPTDRGRPLGKDQETGRASKTGHSSQPQYRGPYPVRLQDSVAEPPNLMPPRSARLPLDTKHLRENTKLLDSVGHTPRENPKIHIFAIKITN